MLQPKFTLDNADASVRVGGFEAIFKEVSEQIESDLAKAESIAIPITLILLIIVFGSLVAASLPIGIGILAVLGTFLVLRLIAAATDVSVFALSMVTAMGLGLAIDYSLFIVSRFREELRKGADTETAIVTTVKTAGRTVIFSGSTVAVSLAALLVFPLYFFKSFGYAGIGVVITAVAGAVIALPALLAVLGPRVDWSPGFFPFKQLTSWQRAHHKEVGEGFWHRLAVLVMKRPWRFAIGVDAGPARARHPVPAREPRSAGRAGAPAVRRDAQGARLAAQRFLDRRGQLDPRRRDERREPGRRA